MRPERYEEASQSSFRHVRKPGTVHRGLQVMEKRRGIGQFDNVKWGEAKF